MEAARSIGVHCATNGYPLQCSLTDRLSALLAFNLVHVLPCVPSFPQRSTPPPSGSVYFTHTSLFCVHDRHIFFSSSHLTAAHPSVWVHRTAGDGDGVRGALPAHLEAREERAAVDVQPSGRGGHQGRHGTCSRAACAVKRECFANGLAALHVES